MRIHIKKIIPILILLLLAIPLIWPLFSPGFFPMHDDTQPTRVYEMAQALLDGQFPVRWVKDLGYGFGYPLFNFYAPLPYYVGAVFVLLGFDVIVATKIMFGIGILISGIGMYLLSEKYWGIIGGIISGVFYLYGPYHAVQIYVRGAVGEYWGYALLPFVFWGIAIARKNLLQGIVIGGIAFAALILSHNILAFITAGLLFIWLCIQLIFLFLGRTNRSSVAVIIGVISIGLSLSSFFWLPALAEANLTNTGMLISGTNDFHSHFLDIDQLWDWPWGYAGSGPGRADGMSLKIGKLHIIFTIISIGILIRAVRKKSKLQHGPDYLFFILGTFISILMTLYISEWIWNSITPLSYIQYPWRFLAFTLFFMSILIGAMASHGFFLEKHPAVYIGYGFIVLAVIYYNGKYFQPQYLNPKTSADYTQEQVIKWNISKISDEYLPVNFQVPLIEADTAHQEILSQNDIIITESEIASNRRRFVVSADKPAEIVFSVAYFPGWRFFVDAREIKPKIVNGLPAVEVSAGGHYLTAYFGNTTVRLVGNIISGITLMFLFIILGSSRLFLRHEKI